MSLCLTAAVILAKAKADITNESIQSQLLSLTVPKVSPFPLDWKFLQGCSDGATIATGHKMWLTKCGSLCAVPHPKIIFNFVFFPLLTPVTHSIYIRTVSSLRLLSICITASGSSWAVRVHSISVNDNDWEWSHGGAISAFALAGMTVGGCYRT